MIHLLNKVRSIGVKVTVASMAVCATLVAGAGAAFAQYTPSNAASDITVQSNNLAAGLPTIVTSVFGALIGVILLLWGIGYLRGWYRKRHGAVG